MSNETDTNRGLSDVEPESTHGDEPTRTESEADVTPSEPDTGEKLLTWTGWLGVVTLLAGVAFVLAALQSPIALVLAGQTSELAIRGPRLAAGLVVGLVLLGIGFWGVTQSMRSIEINVTLE
jgi:LPXTG-motif cell wall-anchored protein